MNLKKELRDPNLPPHEEDPEQEKGRVADLLVEEHTPRARNSLAQLDQLDRLYSLDKSNDG